MAVGDIGKWRNSAAAAFTYTATFAPVDEWDTEDRNDNSYYTKTADQTITAATVGNYLVVATIRSNDHSNRFCPFMRVTQANVAQSGSVVGGYARNSGNPHWQQTLCFPILNAAPDIEIEVAGTGLDLIGTLEGNTTTLTVMHLPDDSESAFLHLQTPTGGAFSGQTWNTVSGWDVVRETDDTVIELGATDSEIILREDDRWYLCGYSVPMNQTSGSRTQRISRVTFAGHGENAAHGYAYLRDATSRWGCCKNTFLARTTAADQVMELEIQRGDADVDGTIAALVAAGEAGFWVWALPAGAECIIARDQTAAQAIGGNVNPVLNAARTVDVNDAASWAGNGVTQVETQQAIDDVLAGAGVFANRSDTSATRLLTRTVLTVNATGDFATGSQLWIRGNQGTTDTFDGASNTLGHLETLASGDDIGIDSRDHGDAGSVNDTTQADQVGMWAINLDTALVVGGSGSDVDFESIVAAVSSVASTSLSRTVGYDSSVPSSGNLSVGFEVTRDLAAVLAGVSSLQAVVHRTRDLVGEVAGLSSISADLSMVIDLVASIAADSSVTATLERIVGFSASLVADSSIQGQIDRDVSFVASLPTISSISGDLTRARELAATLSSLSAVSGDLTRVRDLSVDLPSVSSIIASLEKAKELGMVLNSTSSVSASVDRLVGLTVDVPAISQLAADLERVASIAASVVSTGSVSSSLSRTVDVSSLISSVSFLVASLEKVKGLAVSINASSSSVASLERVADLAAQIAALSSVSAQVSILRDLVAQVTGDSAISGTLDIGSAIDLAVTISAASGLSVSLDRLVGYGASVDALSGLSSSLAVTRELVAQTAGLSAVLADLDVAGAAFVDFVATVASLSAVGGSLSRVRELDATLPGVSGLIALNDRARALNVDVSSVSGLLANFERLRGFDAEVAGDSSVVGGLEAVRDLEAGVVAQSSVAGTLARLADLACSVPGVSGVSANLIADLVVVALLLEALYVSQELLTQALYVPDECHAEALFASSEVLIEGLY